MSLHPPIKADRSSTYSALVAVEDSPPLAGERAVPIITWKRASKWNRDLYKPGEPFVVAFDTIGVDERRGVKSQELILRSPAMLDTMVVRGGELVGFPEQQDRIQLRIVVSTGCFRVVSGRSF